MTYLDLVLKLKECESSAPEHEAAELIRIYLGKPREWCLLNNDVPLESNADIERALLMRRQGIPLQYIIGEAWFYGYKFTVTSDCLIPQPDTEHIVEWALKRATDGCMLLDLCTGSGCIAISILNERKDIRAAAVDISRPALAVAQSNASLHNCADRLSFIEADVLDDEIIALVKNADVIVSNPPYINTSVIPTLSAEVQNEPHIALDGGDDGLRFYRHFILELTRYMKPEAIMIIEIGYDQSEKIAELCRLAGVMLTLHRDFGNNIRVAEISRGNSSCTE